jgi:hypothetical protein
VLWTLLRQRPCKWAQQDPPSGLVHPRATAAKAAAAAAASAEQVSERVAGKARGAADPRVRGYARMALGGLSRGGTHGDEIRHGILNVMRDFGIREGNRPVRPLGRRTSLPASCCRCRGGPVLQPSGCSVACPVLPQGQGQGRGLAYEHGSTRP